MGSAASRTADTRCSFERSAVKQKGSAMTSRVETSRRSMDIHWPTSGCGLSLPSFAKLLRSIRTQLSDGAALLDIAETAELDGAAADMIFQVATCGEVIYG